MSPTAAPPAGSTAAPTPADQTAAGAPAPWHRRNRVVVVVAVLVLLSVVLAVVTAPRQPGEPLSPGNAAPEGARAVAEVLSGQGVTLRQEQRLDDVVAAGGPEVTVLVLDAGLLPPEQLRRLRDSGSELVLVEPTLPVLQVLAPELTLGGTAEDYVAAPGCDDRDAVVAGEARAGGTRYLAAEGGTVPGVQGEQASPTATVEVCYPRGTGTNPQAGSYAVVVDPEQQRRVVVHGQPDVLTNEWLAQEGDAALAMRSLGRQETLLWYRVDPFDPALARPDEAPDAVDLLPSWVGWAALQLVLVGLVAVLWRSRRLGRLVPERLPAVVRSAETAEGRARLYRSAGARDAGARVLRRAAARRLASRLGTGADPDPASLARLVAAASGRDPVQVGLLLDGPAPTDDAGLVRLADDLDRLEREVTHR